MGVTPWEMILDTRSDYQYTRGTQTKTFADQIEFANVHMLPYLYILCITSVFLLNLVISVCE